MNGSKRWELVQAALDGEELERLADRAAAFLGNPLVVIGNTGAVIAHSRQIPVPDEIWNNAMKRGYVTLEFMVTLGNWDRVQDAGTRYEQLTVDRINAHRRRFFRLIVEGELLGYLNVLETARSLEEMDEEDCHFVVQLLAKELHAKLGSGEVGQGNRREELLLGLLRERFKSRGQLQDQLVLARMPADARYRVVCSDLRDFLSYNADQDLFHLELAQLFPGSTAVISERTLVLLVSGKEDIAQRAETFLAEKKLFFGASDEFDDLFCFPRYHQQALDALRFRQYLVEPPFRTVFYDEVKLFGLLDRIPAKELPHYCGTGIYAVWQYDAAHGTEYLETLSSYLRQNRSVKAAARELHLHRNTVNYRVGRLRELFGLDLEDIPATCRMLVSCEILRMLQKTGQRERRPNEEPKALREIGKEEYHV